jgi:hypothetical protein
MIIFLAVIAVVVGVAVVIALARQPPPPAPDCAAPPCNPPTAPEGGVPAGDPAGGIVVDPSPDSTAPPLQLDGRWASEALGISLEFDIGDWTEKSRDDSSLFLLDPAGGYSLYIEVAPADQVTPSAMADDRLSFLQTKAPDLGPEADRARQALGAPSLGYRRAEASLLAGTYVSGGDQEPWTVALLWSGDAKVSVVVQLVAVDDARDDAFLATDPILNSIRWP